MKFKKALSTITLLLFLGSSIVLPSTLYAHPGATDPDGGHYCRTNCDKYGVPWNERHFHNSGSTSPSVDNSKPRTYAKGTSARRKGRRKIATAKLRWKVKDNSNTVYVKLRIQKRIKSRSRVARKARYLRRYRAYRGKYLKYRTKYRKIRNRTLRRRYKRAAVKYRKAKNKYLRAYRKTKTIVYKTVKVPNYRWTRVNKWRAYKWKTRSKGVYRYLVYAKDKAGNSQRNVAKAGFRIR